MRTRTHNGRLYSLEPRLLLYSGLLERFTIRLGVIPKGFISTVFSRGPLSASANGLNFFHFISSPRRAQKMIKVRVPYYARSPCQLNSLMRHKC